MPELNHITKRMRVWSVIFSGLVVASLAGNRLPPSAEVAPPNSAMRALEAAPVDASLWIRVADGAALMKSERFAALASTLATKVLFREGAARWRGLAERLGLSEAEAFERYLGSDMRIVMRAEAAGQDWAVLTRVAASDVDRLVRALRPTIGAGGRYDLPEERLVLAYRAPWLVISGSASSRLFVDLASRFEAPLDTNLATVVKTSGVGELPPGRVSAVVALPAPFEGRAIIGGDIENDRLRIACRGTFARPALPGAEQATLDIAVLARFDDTAVASMVDPVRTKVGPEDAFLVASLPELVPPATFRGNLGARRLVVVGEVDGSGATPKMNMRCPAVAVAYEVDDADQGRDDQDALMKVALDGLRERFAKPQGMLLPPASIPNDKIGDARSADLGGLIRSLTDNHPLARTCSLNWRVVHGRCGAWQVYATHPEWLAKVGTTLSSGPRDVARPVKAANAGHCCGGRLAAHMRSWSGEADAFVGVSDKPEGKSSDKALRGFRDGIELLALIAERFRNVRWTVGIPSERAISLDIEAELAVPSSAQPVTQP